MPSMISTFERSTPLSLFSSPSTAALQWPQLISGTLNVASVICRPPFLDLQKPLDGGGQFLYLLVGVLAFLDGLADAVLYVVLQEDGASFLQGRDYARDLGENVHTVGLLVHHPLHAPHLPLYAPEAVLNLLFFLRLNVAVGGSPNALCSLFHQRSFLYLKLRSSQLQGVTEHGHAGKRHRRRREHGVQEAVLTEEGTQEVWHRAARQERVEHARRDRDQQNVVGEGPEEVLLYVPYGCLREPYGPRHPAHVPRDERQVCGLHRHIRAGACRHADVRSRQGRSVVDPVANHRDDLAFGLKLLDLALLVLGQDLGENAVNAELTSYGVRRPAVVAGQHGDLEAHLLQCLHRLARLLAHHVGDCHESRGVPVH